MMSDLVRNLRIQREEIDPDIIADYSFILGDLNYRMETTYVDLIPKMHDILVLKESLDQLQISMNKFGKYPGY
jgi:hypothetical protein